MRPGSPLAFGRIGKTPWLGLPGNPVSTLVTFELFGRPAIRRLMGHTSLYARRIRVRVAEPITLAGSLTHFLRVRLAADGDGLPVATLAGPQASNILSSAARADALLIVPSTRSAVAAGDTLLALPLGEAGSYQSAP
jgi:molybdopterin molybdotransferase